MKHKWTGSSLWLFLDHLDSLAIISIWHSILYMYYCNRNLHILRMHIVGFDLEGEHETLVT